MKVRYLARDLRRFCRCPHGRLYSALKKHFGQSLKRYRWVDDRNNQSKGVDLIVELQDGRILLIELKQPQQHPLELDSVSLPLETWSSREAKARGILLKGGMKADYILWLYPTGASVLMAFRTLAAVFRRQEKRWKDRFHVHQCKNHGLYGNPYTSECVFVPYREIRRGMRRHMRLHGINYEPSIAE